jgi:hypothetical protein
VGRTVGWGAYTPGWTDLEAADLPQEVVPPGPRAGDEAERVRSQLLSQVDQRRSPRTRATVDQLSGMSAVIVGFDSAPGALDRQRGS